MALERLEVKDYQSLKDVDIPFGRFTVIVGPSGNGKSALIRALKALCFNQVGHRFIRHHQQKAWVRLTFGGGKVIEWEKPKDKGATYVAEGQEYTRTGRSVPQDIEDMLSIRRIVIDKGVTFTPQFHSQHDLPLLLTESSTLAARALAKLTKLSVLVEAQMACRRDLGRVKNERKAAGEETERLKEQIGAMPNVARASNVLNRAIKLKRGVDKNLDVAKQAADIVQDISGSLLIADMPLPTDAEVAALEERMVRLEKITVALALIDQATAAMGEHDAEVILAQDELTALEKEYEELVAELGACPLCGSAEMWGKHDHEEAS